MYTGFWSERGHYEDLDIGRRIILRWILGEIGWGGMDWIVLAQNENQWRALVNMVINLSAS
jgi:hypothetical protein